MVKETMVKESQLLQEIGKKLVDELEKYHFNVKLAMWTLFKDENRWQLILATPYYDMYGPLQAYEKVQEILNMKNNVGMKKYIGLQDITILSPHNAFVREMRRIFHEGQSGGMPISASGSVSERYADAFFYRVF